MVVRILAACLLIMLSSQAGALCGELKLMEILELPESGGPRWVSPTGRLRPVIICEDLDAETHRPALVCARGSEVWYIDMATLEVVRKNRYSRDERPIISQDGRLVSLLSQTEDRESGYLVRKIVVENWRGDHLWETGARYRGRGEPTSAGGLVIYPACESPIAESGTYMLRYRPRPERHGLVVYDGEGDIVLNSADLEGIPCGFGGVMSPEGRYFVFAYRWVSEERAALYGERACVILVDLNEAVEVWRRYIDARSVSGIAVGPEAERIMCFPYLHEDFRVGMVLFDREGREIEIGRNPGMKLRSPFIGPVLSPGGRFAAFTVKDAVTHVVRMEDGSEAWRFDCPFAEDDLDFDAPGSARKGSVACLSLTDEGGALLAGAKQSATSGEYERFLWVIGGNGEVLEEIDTESVRTGGPIYAGWVSDDGNLLWLVQDKALSLYSLEVNMGE